MDGSLRRPSSGGLRPVGVRGSELLGRSSPKAIPASAILDSGFPLWEPGVPTHGDAPTLGASISGGAASTSACATGCGGCGASFSLRRPHSWGRAPNCAPSAKRSAPCYRSTSTGGGRRIGLAVWFGDVAAARDGGPPGNDDRIRLPSQRPQHHPCRRSVSKGGNAKLRRRRPPQCFCIRVSSLRSSLCPYQSS